SLKEQPTCGPRPPHITHNRILGMGYPWAEEGICEKQKQFTRFRANIVAPCDEQPKLAIVLKNRGVSCRKVVEQDCGEFPTPGEIDGSIDFHSLVLLGLRQQVDATS